MRSLTASPAPCDPRPARIVTPTGDARSAAGAAPDHR